MKFELEYHPPFFISFPWASKEFGAIYDSIFLFLDLLEKNCYSLPLQRNLSPKSQDKSHSHYLSLIPVKMNCYLSKSISMYSYQIIASCTKHFYIAAPDYFVYDSVMENGCEKDTFISSLLFFY